MLGLYFFKRLTAQEQGEMTLTHGTLIAQRFEGSYHIALYSLSDFFVEFWLAKADNQAQEEIKSFKSRSCLMPYLTEISIQDIFVK